MNVFGVCSDLSEESFLCVSGIRGRTGSCQCCRDPQAAWRSPNAAFSHSCRRIEGVQGVERRLQLMRVLLHPSRVAALRDE